MKSERRSKSVSLVGAAALYGRITNTIGTVFAIIVTILLIVAGVFLVSKGDSMGWTLILIGAFMGSISIILYRAVQKNRNVAAFVGAANFFGGASNGLYGRGGYGGGGFMPFQLIGF